MLLEAQLYAQDKRKASGITATINILRLERDEIRNKLEDGVDEDTRAGLEKRLEVLGQRLVLLKNELSSLRTPIGNPVMEAIYVE